VSLWRVADDSTAQLMVRFYERLRGGDGMPKVDALRAATLQTKADRRWSSLYHWAPFVLVGDWE
jgi:CHAT domain-containing protein